MDIVSPFFSTRFPGAPSRRAPFVAIGHSRSQNGVAQPVIGPAKRPDPSARLCRWPVPTRDFESDQKV